MSILNLFKNQLGTKLTVEEFYLDCKIEKIEWWLSYCHEYPDLFWARLRKFSNGKADVLFQDENKVFGFENAEFAGYFISEDEFIRFDETFDTEDRSFVDIPPEINIDLPDWANKEVKEFEYIGKY